MKALLVAIALALITGTAYAGHTISRSSIVTRQNVQGGYSQAIVQQPIVVEQLVQPAYVVPPAIVSAPVVQYQAIQTQAVAACPLGGCFSSQSIRSSQGGRGRSRSVQSIRTRSR